LKGHRTKLSAAARLEVRDIVREELEKVGITAQGGSLAASAEPGESGS